MSRAQRLTFLGISVIIAVVAVIVLSGGDTIRFRAPLGRLKVQP